MFNAVTTKQEQETINNLFASFDSVSKYNGINKQKQSDTNATALITLLTVISGSSAIKSEVRSCTSTKLQGKYAGNKTVKAIVSKALAVAEYLEQGRVIPVDNLEVSEDYLADYNTDNLPAITVSSLYQFIKTEEKAEKAEDKKQALVSQWFKDNKGHSMIQEKNIMPETFEAELNKAISHADSVLSEVKAEAAPTLTMEAIKAAILSLSQAEVAEIAEFASELATQESEKKVA